MFGHTLEIESEGSTLDVAVNQGIDRFGCSRAEVDIEILQLPAKGFLGLFGARPAKVRIRLTDRALIARRSAQKLLRLTGIEAKVDALTGSERIDLTIDSEESNLIIGRRGVTLEALQSLVITLTDREVQDRTPIVIDIDGYRQRKEFSLRRLARRLSSQVRRTGRKATIDPLPPEDRRLFHLALKEEYGVECRSVGQGIERKMVLSPRKT